MQTKEIQGALWSTAPADWAGYMEPTFIPLYQAVLDELMLDEEKMILDAGCGSGLFLSMASATGASIHGIDAAPGLLSIAKERLHGVTLLSEDLEALPFIDGTFDVVTGFNSFQYAGSFEKALAEATRVVKRYGRIVIGLWGREAVCEATHVLRAVTALMPPPPPDAQAHFVPSDDWDVQDYCKAAGLSIVKKEAVFTPWSFTSDEALVKAFLSTAHCAKAVQAVGEAEVIETILSNAQPFNVADQVYYMRNYINFYITRKTR